MAGVDNEDTLKRLFGPLSFEENIFTDNQTTLEQECLLCNQYFSLDIDVAQFLTHLFQVHYLIIDDFQNIDKVDKYVEFWRNKLKNKSIESMIPSVKISDTSQFYFVLSNLIKDDMQIRHQLRLEKTLELQEKERLCDIKRNCLFCKLQFKGKYVDYIKHLSNQHNLQLGKPENLVYISELLDVIEEKLTSLKCIYCEKTFTDRNVLKEHMRKKLHKRINPSNHFYDKFYIVNYLEVGRDWQHLQKDDDSVAISIGAEDSDQEWSDWNEREQEIVCLVCDYRHQSLINICDHMKYSHTFDFQTILKDFQYYQRVKLVNYIRRQMHIMNCIKCDQHFEGKAELLDHLKTEQHLTIPDLKIFNQPEYYFPTYENDTLLYYLEEIHENEV